MNARFLGWAALTVLALVPLALVVYGVGREAPLFDDYRGREESAGAAPQEQMIPEATPELEAPVEPDRPGDGGQDASSGSARPAARAEAPAPGALSTAAGAASPNESRELAASAVADAPEDCMRIPVAGVASDELMDTFAEARGDRLHHAIDIHAPRWTPVVAAADGEVQKIWESAAGGHTVYVLGEEESLRYYYAHLEAYREGLEEGDDVDAGEVIAYVGDSGNAVPGNTHLHFAVLLFDEEESWASGTAVDPLPYLRCEVRLPS